MNGLRCNFVSGVSHELKTPLTLIRLYAETLLESPDLAEDERINFYNVISQESDRLLLLVGRVLDFSRIGQVQKQYQLQPGDAGPVIAGILERCHAYLGRQGFVMHWHVQQGLPLVSFDAEAIKSAALNLIDNAAKYSGTSKFLKAELRFHSQAIVLEVEDHGIGIPAADRDKIFQAFYRSDNTGGKGGCGLGLFLVKHIMEAHGGTIEMESEIGVGTRVRLLFPVQASTPDSLASVQPACGSA
jgi:two-component system phosphate regulon sensor histidine kinase PhoR